MPDLPADCCPPRHADQSERWANLHSVVTVRNIAGILRRDPHRRHWERDLVDHLVLLRQLQGDEPLAEALAEVKSDFPNLASDEVVRAAGLESILTREASR